MDQTEYDVFISYSRKDYVDSFLQDIRIPLHGLVMRLLLPSA